MFPTWQIQLISIECGQKIDVIVFDYPFCGQENTMMDDSIILDAEVIG